ncbi:MAG: cysteine--tRNA ligase [Clostridia bacterium]|nr:cysteine--tRNA ligase [Clostridia bacterium]
MIKLYNSLTKKISDFYPINDDGTVKMYSCGPTVYNFPHIGNMRAYLFMDLLRRVLKYNKYKVYGVMNITDVGHLTSDEDEGEDKMEKSAKKENKSVYEIAQFYTDAFLKDLNALNIDLPEKIVKATDHIQEMIDFILQLEKNGFTYKISDGIYFDTSKFADYGKLSGMALEEKLAGARVEVNAEKRNPTDFALWKFVDENHIMKWASPFGVGCPGWHIECSAMGTKYLGEHFDIHTGGIDHLPVHHENEIAQNNCALGHKVVERWLHCEFLQIDGGKMSKSLGNVYTLNDLSEKGFSPLDFRYFTLQTSYRKKQNFTFVAIESSKTALSRLRTLVNSNKDVKRKLTSDEIAKLTNFSIAFTDAINDDLNSPLALGVLWDMLKEMPKSEDVYALAIRFDEVLGLDLDKDFNDDESLEIPNEIVELAKARLEARKAKDFAKADELRNQIESQGYKVLDTKDGFEISKL